MNELTKISALVLSLRQSAVTEVHTLNSAQSALAEVTVWSILCLLFRNVIGYQQFKTQALRSYFK